MRYKFKGSQSSGVTVKICIRNGAIRIYGSYTVPNPSAALHDFSDFLNVTNGMVTPENCSVSHVDSSDVMGASNNCSLCRSSSQRKKRQILGGEDIVVHITIEDVSDKETDKETGTETGPETGTKNDTETETQFYVESSIGRAFGKG